MNEDWDWLQDMAFAFWIIVFVVAAIAAVGGV